MSYLQIITHTPYDEQRDRKKSMIALDKGKLKKFVIRRRWQVCVHNFSSLIFCAFFAFVRLQMTMPLIMAYTNLLYCNCSVQENVPVLDDFSPS